MNSITQAALTTAFAPALLTLGVTIRAYADEGYLPPTSTACTDQVRSDRGAFIYGWCVSNDPADEEVVLLGDARR